jgi:2-oxoglutarate ferredoxin oxidoreductase subunit delta
MSRVTFKNERCKGCGHCISVCPKKIIGFSENFNIKGYHFAGVSEENMKLCIACAACARMCPDAVIKVEK